MDRFSIWGADKRPTKKLLHMMTCRPELGGTDKY